MGHTPSTPSRPVPEIPEGVCPSAGRGPGKGDCGPHPKWARSWPIDGRVLGQEPYANRREEQCLKQSKDHGPHSATH